MQLQIKMKLLSPISQLSYTIICTSIHTEITQTLDFISETQNIDSESQHKYKYAAYLLMFEGLIL